MSATYDKDRRSSGSSKTDFPDLERGEASHEKEEEAMSQEKVCSFKHVFIS
jgi:hypothetical protein